MSYPLDPVLGSEILNPTEYLQQAVDLYAANNGNTHAIHMQKVSLLLEFARTAHYLRTGKIS